MKKSKRDNSITAVMALLIIISEFLFVFSFIHDYGISQYEDLLMYVVGIMTSSAAILAIGITVFNAMLSDVSKMYNADIQRIIADQHKPHRGSLLFILTIVACVSFIFIPDQFTDQIMLIISNLFLASLYLLYRNLHNTSLIRNPTDMIDLMHDRVVRNFEIK